MDYIAGVDVHAELGQILGRRRGWGGIDISVLTRDLDRSTLEKPGMGEFIKNTIGVSIDHIKKNSSCKEWSQYRYIRQFGWEKEKICEEKIVYAAMDASLSLVIVFNYVREYELRYKKFDREVQFVDIKKLISESLDNLVDRKFNQAGFNRWFDKNLETQEAAMILSKPVLEADEEVLKKKNTGKYSSILCTKGPGH